MLCDQFSSNTTGCEHSATATVSICW